MTVVNFRSYGCDGRTPIDFRLRMNECECLKERFNPFLISTGEVRHERYVPLHALNEKAVPDHEGEPVGMYPPWSYSMFLPLSCLPRNVAWMIWYAISVLSLAGIGFFAFDFGRRGMQGAAGGFLCSAAALSIFSASYLDLGMGNLCLVIAFSLVGILHSVSHEGWRSSLIGGLCLAVAMMKPQLGLLFGIPMLLSKRYAAIAFAAGLLILMSIIPSVLCGTSPVVMALQAPQANEPGFHGCGLMPECVANWICARFQVDMKVPLVVAFLGGVVLCAALSWKLRCHPNALVRLVPASALSVLWTYAAFYNYAVCWIVLVVLAVEFIPASFGRRLFLLAAFFLFVRGVRPLVRVVEFFGLSESNDAFGGWGGLLTGFCNSASVIALLALCLMIIVRDVEPIEGIRK